MVFMEYISYCYFIAATNTPSMNLEDFSFVTTKTQPVALPYQIICIAQTYY